MGIVSNTTSIPTQCINTINSFAKYVYLRYGAMYANYVLCSSLVLALRQCLGHLCNTRKKKKTLQQFTDVDLGHAGALLPSTKVYNSLFGFYSGQVRHVKTGSFMADLAVNIIFGRKCVGGSRA